MQLRACAVLLLATVQASACDTAPEQKASDEPDLAGALSSISPEQLRQHTEVLAADSFASRFPLYQMWQPMSEVELLGVPAPEPEERPRI
jgi:hypothetical protein